MMYCLRASKKLIPSFNLVSKLSLFIIIHLPTPLPDLDFFLDVDSSVNKLSDLKYVCKNISTMVSPVIHLLSLSSFSINVT